MFRKGIATGLGFSFVLFGFCALLQAQDVRYNFAPGVDWAKFKTYRWVEVEGATKPSPLVNDQIIQSIDGQLASKGLTKTEGDKPDLLITYQAAVNEEKQWSSTNFGGYGYGPYGYGGWGGTGGTTTGTTSTIKVGTLVVDLYDAQAKKHVWRGDATKTLNPSKNPEKNQERLNKAIAKLMKNYPPPEKKK
ncbi:MAG: DUF4136 domain-containing protein [Acidobacteria bacterium]|nr:MAG: DUF4136 domain-containing protein [Acidobacteriota bacterium]